MDIKGMIFDFGGVISLPQDSGYVERMLGLLGIEDRDAFHAVYMELRPAYDGGYMTAAAFWEAVTARFGCPPAPLSTLIDLDVRSWTQINRDTLDFAAALRDHGIITAVLSNMNVDVLAYIEREFPWIRGFDHLVYSCDLGICKPQREIYEYCVSRMGLLPGECVFADDGPANVGAAGEYGIHAVLFEGQESLKALKQGYFRNIFADKKTQ